MSGMDNEAAGREKPDMKLSRRSLVAAAAVLAAMGPLSVRQARAQGVVLPPNVPPDDTLYGRLCQIEGNQNQSICLCFLSGTRLLTPSGEIAIENLRIGDLVVTENGQARPIRWIGRITVDRDGDAPWHIGAMAVRVAKDALGKGCPHRDLYLSRSHMVHLNGVLIPIGDLINGRTISAVDVEGHQIAYFHVELETHDVVLAEGVPCETLLTTAEKLAVFDNVDEYYALYGAPADMVACSPLSAFVGGRSELKSRLRSAIAVVVDIREPRDVARDCLEARAIELSKAA